MDYTKTCIWKSKTTGTWTVQWHDKIRGWQITSFPGYSWLEVIEKVCY